MTTGLDIGRHDDYEQAQEEFESVRARLIPPDESPRKARPRHCCPARPSRPALRRRPRTTVSMSFSVIRELSGSGQLGRSAVGLPGLGNPRRAELLVLG